MGVLNPNSTSYVHPDEPNLLNLHKTMQYNGNGEPEIRTHVHGITLNSGDVIVSNVTIDSGNITVWQGTDPWKVTGNVNANVTGSVVLSSGNVNANVSGSIVVSSGNINANVTGSVVISGNANITNTPNVHITNTPDITGNVIVTGNVSITSIPEIEIKNDTGNPIPISKDTNVNSTTNRIYVSQETDVILADSNYEMNIARGLVDGQYAIFRSAMNPSCDQNTETSVWVEGGIYPHGTWTSPSILYLASDNVLDVGQTIFIEGLDSNYDYVTATITTNGTTSVSTTQTFIRIYTATIISPSNNSANAGEIRFRIGSSSGTVVAHIRAGFGITKLSQYTVPRGYTAYVLYGDATTFRGGSGNIGSQVRMMVRPFGMSFVCAFIAEVVNGYYRNDFNIPMKITEKSDIDVRIIADANNTVASCNYQLILIPNT